MSDGQMRLRYNGVCRVCATAISAGTVAFYERSTRTILCLECAPTPSLLPPSTLVPTTAAPPASTPEAAETCDLRLRPPAASVIAETLRQQSSAPAPSGLARLFGRTPLIPESLAWYRGAIGELEVARVLDELGPGWQVVHAVPVGTSGSDIDHVIVGPAGVFTINTKFHEGQRVWVASRRILVGGAPTDHLRNSRFEARRSSKALSLAMRRPIDVRPIVAIVGARQITFKERPTDVIVLRSTDLVRWLQRQPDALPTAEVTQLARVIRNPQTWGAPAAEEPDLVSFAALRGAVAAARRTRRRWALAIVALPLAMVGVFQLLVTMLLSFVGAGG